MSPATETSAAAYAEELSSGRVFGLQMRVLEALRKHGAATARELSAASGLDRTVQKRLSELVRLGAVEVTGERPCRVSGRSAQVWAAKGFGASATPPGTRSAPAEVRGGIARAEKSSAGVF